MRTSWVAAARAASSAPLSRVQSGKSTSRWTSSWRGSACSSTVPTGVGPVRHSWSSRSIRSRSPKPPGGTRRLGARAAGSSFALSPAERTVGSMSSRSRWSPSRCSTATACCPSWCWASSWAYCVSQGPAMPGRLPMSTTSATARAGSVRRGGLVRSTSSWPVQRRDGLSAGEALSGVLAASSLASVLDPIGTAPVRSSSRCASGSSPSEGPNDAGADSAPVGRGLALVLATLGGSLMGAGPPRGSAGGVCGC